MICKHFPITYKCFFDLPYTICTSGIALHLIAVARAQTNEACRMGQYTKLQDSYGYVSSQVAREQGVGTIQCPWRIEALPGQSISITFNSLGEPVNQHNCKTVAYVLLHLQLTKTELFM